jgi:putative transposase
MGERRRHSAALKAKVAVEAIRGERSINELAGLYQVHPALIAVWRKRALEGMVELFADGRQKGRQDDEALKAHLYQEIGQLKVELDFLKKKCGLLG